MRGYMAIMYDFSLFIDRIIHYGPVPTHGIVCGYRAMTDDSVDHSITSWRLTHCGLLCWNHAASQIVVNFEPSNGLFFDGTKPLSESKLSSQHHRDWGYLGGSLTMLMSHDLLIFKMGILIHGKEGLNTGFRLNWENIYKKHSKR